jgi:hypothetical protein
MTEKPKKSVVEFVVKVTKEGGPDLSRPPSVNGPMTARRPSESSTIPGDEAQAKGWTVVNMKEDWNTIFPAE